MKYLRFQLKSSYSEGVPPVKGESALWPKNIKATPKIERAYQKVKKNVPKEMPLKEKMEDVIC